MTIVIAQPELEAERLRFREECGEATCLALYRYLFPLWRENVRHQDDRPEWRQFCPEIWSQRQAFGISLYANGPAVMIFELSFQQWQVALETRSGPLEDISLQIQASLSEVQSDDSRGILEGSLCIRQRGQRHSLQVHISDGDITDVFIGLSHFLYPTLRLLPEFERQTVESCALLFSKAIVGDDVGKLRDSHQLQLLDVFARKILTRSVR